MEEAKVIEVAAQAAAFLSQTTVTRIALISRSFVGGLYPALSTFVLDLSHASEPQFLIHLNEGRLQVTLPSVTTMYLTGRNWALSTTLAVLRLAPKTQTLITAGFAYDYFTLLELSKCLGSSLARLTVAGVASPLGLFAQLSAAQAFPHLSNIDLRLCLPQAQSPSFQELDQLREGALPSLASLRPPTAFPVPVGGVQMMNHQMQRGSVPLGGIQPLSAAVVPSATPGQSPTTQMARGVPGAVPTAAVPTQRQPMRTIGHLDLSGTNITGAGLKKLVDIIVEQNLHLGNINLSDTKVGDEGLREVARLTARQVAVVLKGTPITDEGLGIFAEALKASLPTPPVPMQQQQLSTFLPPLHAQHQPLHQPQQMKMQQGSSLQPYQPPSQQQRQMMASGPGGLPKGASSPANGSTLGSTPSSNSLEDRRAQLRALAAVNGTLRDFGAAPPLALTSAAPLASASNLQSTASMFASSTSSYISPVRPVSNALPSASLPGPYSTSPYDPRGTNPQRYPPSADPYTYRGSSYRTDRDAESDRERMEFYRDLDRRDRFRDLDRERRAELRAQRQQYRRSRSRDRYRGRSPSPLSPDYSPDRRSRSKSRFRSRSKSRSRSRSRSPVRRQDRDRSGPPIGFGISPNPGPSGGGQFSFGGRSPMGMMMPAAPSVERSGPAASASGNLLNFFPALAEDMTAGQTATVRPKRAAAKQAGGSAGKAKATGARKAKKTAVVEWPSEEFEDQNGGQLDKMPKHLYRNSSPPTRR